MPYIWRQQQDAANPGAYHPEALSCLEAGYVLIDITRQEIIFSASLLRLLNLHGQVESEEDLARAFRPDAATRLTAMLLALKNGQVTATAILPLQEAERAVVARACIVPAQERVAVLWLTDASAEYRQQQRLQSESEKLKGEVKNMSNVLNIMPFPVWQRNDRLEIEYYNLAYGEIAESSDDNASSVPELHRRERAMAEAALSSGNPKTERRHIVVAGERRLFELKEFPLPQDKTVVGLALDVTETETLQQELERHSNAQSDFLESSASAMAIFGKDMKLTRYNYAYAALWKLDETWLDTRPSYGEILEQLREKRILPEQANFVHFKQQQLKLFTDLIEPREEFFYLPDGKALRVIAIPHALGGLMFAYEDVTDRLTLERSYNTLIAVQRETLDNLHEAIAVFGEDGRLKLFNPMYLTMWNLEPEFVRSEPHISEIIERVKSLQIYDDWEAFKAERISMIQSRKAIRSRLERRDEKVLDCSVVPLPDGATLVSYLDVTDSMRVERSLTERNVALQEADRLKSEFLANVSYELRSPLTSINGFTEMLRQEYFGPLNDRQREYLDGIHNSTQLLIHLVNDILDLGSIEAGYLQLEMREFDILSMLNSVLPLVQERARQSDITLKLDCATAIGVMQGDETRIRQILFKLLLNAIKFSPAGKPVTLGAVAQGESVALWVKDEGYGIPAEEQAQIFGKFYKGNNAEVPKSVARSGTGLGLSIVKNFVELHRGMIELQSEAGKGTLIRCILPRKQG